jgi:steroid 5-alpha reductase family enzyme
VGSYLFLRIVKDGGKDTRFDKIRDKPLLLSTIFLAQAFWVSLCLLPIISLNALPASAFSKLATITPITALGFATYAFGLGYEVLADRQKTEWLKQKKAKKHDEDFITSGFWKYHRYPNYFGEITLWAGMATAAAGVLSSPAGLAALGWSTWPLGKLAVWLLCGASPAFSALVLIKAWFKLLLTKYIDCYREAEFRQVNGNMMSDMGIVKTTVNGGIVHP